VLASRVFFFVGTGQLSCGRTDCIYRHGEQQDVEFAIIGSSPTHLLQYKLQYGHTHVLKEGGGRSVTERGRQRTLLLSTFLQKHHTGHSTDRTAALATTLYDIMTTSY